MKLIFHVRIIPCGEKKSLPEPEMRISTLESVAMDFCWKTVKVWGVSDPREAQTLNFLLQS